jgi:hypothetical protein
MKDLERDLPGFLEDSRTWILKKPDELWKTEKQAKAWLNWTRNPKTRNQQYGAEENAIETNKIQILEQIILDLKTNDFNLVELGCGGGEKGLKLVAAFVKLGARVKYAPEDKQRIFVEYAAAQAVKQGIEVIKTVPGDFFNKDFSKYKIAPTLFYIGGNIFFQKEGLLKLMHRVTGPNDAFIIGTELFPKNLGDMLERYRTNQGVDNWFRSAGERLGFRKSHIAFNPQIKGHIVRWGYQILQVPKTLALEGICAGDRLDLALSLRPTPEELILLPGPEYNVRLFLSSNGEAALAYCRPK